MTKFEPNIGGAADSMLKPDAASGVLQQECEMLRGRFYKR